MEKRFINRDFEQYLKDNADQYRMFPSERVWDNIHQRLHSRRRWYGIGLALLLISTAVITSLLFLPSGRPAPLPLAYQAIPETETVFPVPEAESRTRPVTSPARISTAQQPSVKDRLFPVSTRPEAEPVAETNPVSAPLATVTLQDHNSQPANPPVPAQTDLPVQASSRKPVLTEKQPAAIKPVQPVITRAAPTVLAETKAPAATEPAAQAQIDRPSMALLTPANLLTIESITNTYRHTKARKRLAWHVYATPTITYRKLKENKAFLTQARQAFNMPNNFSFSDINNIVTHKPDIGIQLGVGAAYPLSRRLRITTGLQFNVSKYDIRAYTHTSEVATFALSTNYGGTNSVSTITNYRNIGGYRADWLHNLYVSASAPVGLELNLARPGRAEFGIHGTLQPTYILGNRAYLLSADFKNYAEVPSLTRKWNLNTGLEVFAGYNTKRMSWRIGPQVRYQVFSSFVKQYPISEHLFDIGIKLGVIVK